MRLWFDDNSYYDACSIQITSSMTKNTWLQLHKTEKLNFTKTIKNVVVQFALEDAGSLKASMIKLEKGNLRTSWSPSPSDSYTTKDVQTLVTQTKDSITQTVAATYTTQEAFNNLSVGGRNLAQLTSNLWSDYYTGFTGDINYCINSKHVLIEDLKVGDSICYSVEVECTDLVIASGQTATIKVQGSGDVTSWNSGAFPASPAQKLQEGTYTITLKHTSSIVATHLQNTVWRTNIRVDYVQSGKMRVRNFKVEKGNVHTAWTPAPEDVDTMIDAARSTAIEEAVAAAGQDTDVKLNSYATKTDVSSSIKQTQDSITQSVEKTYETKTNATAQYNGMTTSINSLTTRMTNAESKITDSAIINTVSGTYTTKTDFDTKTKALQSEIDAAEKDIDNVEQSVSTLTTRVSTAEQKITEDAITSTVSKTFVKQTDYNSKVSSIETRVTNAEQKITDDAIVNTVSKSNTFTKQSDFNNMQIGGENFILNSDFRYGWDNWHKGTGYTVNSTGTLVYQQTGLTEDKYYQTYTDPIDVSKYTGQTLTLTFVYNIADKANQTNKTIAYIRFFDSSHEESTSQADSVAYTNVYYPDDYANSTRRTSETQVTVPTNAKFVRVGAYQQRNGFVNWRNFQLEAGNKPTAWKPSVKDVEDDVNNLQSQVESHTEAIASLQINADNISMSVKEVQENTEAAIEALNGNLGTLTNKVEMAMTSTDVQFLIKEQMENGLDSITTETGYTFDKNGLTISKTNSELSTVVDEDGMTIKKNNSEVMLDVNNQGVEAQNVTVDTYLIVGNKSRFEKYGSSRIGCFWIG